MYLVVYVQVEIIFFLKKLGINRFAKHMWSCDRNKPIENILWQFGPVKRILQIQS